MLTTLLSGRGLSYVIGMVCLTLGVIVWTGDRPPKNAACSLPDLLTYLEAHDLQVIRPPHDIPPLSVTYLTKRTDLNWGLCSLLVRQRSEAVKWKNVVSIHQLVPGWDDSFMQREWGPHGMQLGSFLLFGDQELLQQIKTWAGEIGLPQE
jgi:hypothetical protein